MPFQQSIRELRGNGRGSVPVTPQISLELPCGHALRQHLLWAQENHIFKLDFDVKDNRNPDGEGGIGFFSLLQPCEGNPGNLENLSKGIRPGGSFSPASSQRFGASFWLLGGISDLTSLSTCPGSYEGPKQSLPFRPGPPIPVASRERERALRELIHGI